MYVITLGNNAEFNRYCERSFQLPYAYPGPASAQMALLWCADRKLVVTPAALPEVWVEDVSETLAYRAASCIVPTVPTGCLAADLAKDAELLALAAEHVGTDSVYLSPRGITAEVLQLAAALEGLGLRVDRKHLPLADSLWSVEAADCKAGGREVAQRVGPEALYRVPAAHPCITPDCALGAGLHYLQRKGAVVLKSNHGSGGSGVRIVTSPDELKAQLATRALWADRLLIVEEYVGGEAAYHPAFHGIVGDDGIEPRGIGLQMLAGTSFVGTTCGAAVPNDHVSQAVHASGVQIGAALAQTGFRGWYNVDFLFRPETNTLYFVEINARRSGTSAALDAMEHLHGPGWASHTAVQSFERFPVAPGSSLAQAVRGIAAVRRRWASSRAGVLLSIVADLESRSEVGLLAWAATADAVAELVREAAASLGLR